MPKHEIPLYATATQENSLSVCFIGEQRTNPSTIWPLCRQPKNKYFASFANKHVHILSGNMVYNLLIHENVLYLQTVYGKLSSNKF